MSDQDKSPTAPEIKVIKGGSAEGDALLGLLKASLLGKAIPLGQGSSDVPQDVGDVLTLHYNVGPVSLWDVVQLREEHDCTTPSLNIDTDYVVVRVLDRPIYSVDPKTHALQAVDVSVAIKNSHGDHHHYGEVAVDSRRLKVLSNLKDLIPHENQG